MAKKIYVGAPTIPAVEYIETDGTQHINTNAGGGPNIKVEVSFSPNNASTTECIYMAAYYNEGVFEKGFGLMKLADGSRKMIYGTQEITVPGNFVAGETYTFIQDKNKLYENGVLIAEANEETFSTGTNFLQFFAKPLGTTPETYGDGFSGKIYYCKVWVLQTFWRNLVPVLDTNNVPAMHDMVVDIASPHATYVYFLGGNTPTAGPSAGFSYPKARRVAKAYVGINGTAREIKAGYIGVNGVARQFYKALPGTAFTTSPIARGWSGTTTTANTVYYATNEYGEWSCKVNAAANSSSTVAWCAFDGDNSTYCQGGMASASKALYIMFPTGVTISPRKIVIKGASVQQAVGGGISAYGRLAGATSVVLIGSGNLVDGELTINVDTEKFFEEIHITYKGSRLNPMIYEFDITEGMILTQ